MSREYIVTTCDQCPLNLYDEQDEAFCLAEATLIDVDAELGRPEWCPLNDGPILIKAGEP
jgi:hypothetical protein